MENDINKENNSEEYKKQKNPDEINSSDLTEEEIRSSVEGSEDIKKDKKYDDPYLQNAKEIQEFTGREGLGNVNELHSDKSKGVNSDMILGWHSLDIEDMPSKGRFYIDGMKVQIRAAKTAEIRHWSTLNESDMFDVDEKLNHIIQNCSRIQSDKRMLSWKDILEEDRIFLILAIRDLTFKEGENKLQVGKQCPDCGTQNTIDINNSTMQRAELTPEIEKYYDSEEKLYNINTRSYGVIKMKPPTIGVMQIVTKYIAKKQNEGGYWDESYIQLFPYLHTNWRGLKEKAIFDGEVDFQGWPEKKYMLMYRLGEKMKVGVRPEIKVDCTGCEGEITAQVDFRNGIKAIFIPIISDISEELL